MPEKSLFKLQVFGNDAGKFPLDPEILFFPSQWWNSGAVRAGRLGRVSKLILLSENSGLEEDSSGWNGAKWPSMYLSYQASRLQASSGFTPWGSWTWAPSTDLLEHLTSCSRPAPAPLLLFESCFCAPYDLIPNLPLACERNLSWERSPKQVKHH